jgi:uncharacterized RDD family membrane protein YckC
MIKENQAPKGYIGRRFFAALIDYSIQWGILYALIMNFGEPTHDGEYQLKGVLALLPVVFWLVLIVGLEQIGGATIGNGILGLRPRTLNGTKPTFTQSLKRHLVDVIDMFFFGLVAYLIIKNTPLKQRLGDLWAKTIVVKE